MSANSIGFGSQSANTDSKGIKAVKNTFSPEFRNRLDGIVQFNHLSEKVMERIVDKNMKELKAMLSDQGISLSYSANVRSHLAQKGHDPKFGARPLARLIQTEIKDKLTDEILFGELVKGGKLSIGLKDGKLTFNIKST
jgi:ATP-dependent Clp protease ATP-binding subunit ClpA